jgi:hypothetical protein|uniref:Ubiquitin-like protease family profile domain-containing protein n=1 Tax=viral metagenome TaxID=1070528 RepID=A0A6C0AL89_9ZZZZ
MGRKYTKKKVRKKVKKKVRKKSKKKLKGGTVPKKKFIKDNCAPKKDNELLGFTCYTSNALIKIKSAWDKRHPDQKILENDPKEIWNKIKEYMRDTCNRESCWLKHKTIREAVDKNIMDYTFAPATPSKWKDNPNTWLNSVDIGKVMKQYEKKYNPMFQFIGPSPINWDTIDDKECVLEELCKFDLKNYLKRGHYKIGIIFNLDPHYKSGSHWVMLFINGNANEIYYFDSYGNANEKIPSSIMRLVKKIQAQAKQIGSTYTFQFNKTRHQYGNSECGMYCLYMIIQLLKRQSFKYLTGKRIVDKTVWNCRKKYFNI